MALTNVRLGVRVPNPRRLETMATSRFDVGQPGDAPEHFQQLKRRRATPLYVFKEMFGFTSMNDRFLYVTDGGHYDNLGLTELLRRGCTTSYGGRSES